MELEDQVVSLELAKKLKELGVPQISIFAHYDGRIIAYKEGHSVREYGGAAVSAFTVAELGEMLYGVSVKWLPHNQYQDQYLVLAFYLREIRLVNNKTRKLEHREIADTEVDARAKMLIYLIENKLISITN